MVKYETDNRIFYITHKHSPTAKQTLQETVQRLILDAARKEIKTQNTPLDVCKNQSGNGVATK
jgi:hypothetical protein